MRHVFRSHPHAGRQGLGVAALALLLALPAAAQDGWTPEAKTEFYMITGRTGPALYASIGERGPKTSVGRAIAFTDFALTWRRDYVEENGACVLRAARPRLVLTYRLPRPTGRLPPPVRENRARFAAGIRVHEEEHGAIITKMVRRIQAETVGLRAENDPGCRKIKPLLNARLARLSQAQREESRAFDRRELADGGNVHQLVLALVNGG